MNTSIRQIELFPNSLFSEDTLQEEKERIVAEIEKGTHCKCCGQFVKTYKRKLNVGMCVVLIYLCKSGIKDYIHVEHFIKEKGLPQSFRADFHKLTLWKILEAQTEKREDGNPNTGYYKITEKGKCFARNEIEVPESVFIYNNKVEAFSEATINIKAALHNKFNYEELMA